MARGVNKATILGNCGKDPDTRYTPNGNAVTNISVATSEQWTDKQTGQKQERTEWHHIVFFNRLAEVAGEYLRKGSKVYIEGKLQTRKWQDKNGVDHYSTEIVANELQMLGSPPQAPGGYQTGTNRAPGGYQQGANRNQQQQYRQQSQHQPQMAPVDDSFDDDIPF